MYAIDTVRRIVRSWLKQVAKFLDQISRGRLKPSHITVTSLITHIAVAWAIMSGHLVWAGAGLIVFGLMDALDGELARLRNQQSNLGIVLDAVSDRLKETLIFAGITVYLADTTGGLWYAAAPVALGISISLSYIKAKGEAVLASQTDIKLDSQALNRFTGGETLMQFDVRMAMVVVGLFSGYVLAATMLIGLMSGFSLLSRYSELKHILEKE